MDNIVKCSKCNTNFEGKMKKNFLGFRNFICNKCNEKNILPLSKQMLILYFILLFMSIGGIKRLFTDNDPNNLVAYSNNIIILLIYPLMFCFSLVSIIRNSSLKKK